MRPLGRLETDRAIESALSILVVAVALGAAGDALHATALRSLARGLQAARAAGMAMGLWRLARAVALGRARPAANLGSWALRGAAAFTALLVIGAPAALAGAAGVLSIVLPLRRELRAELVRPGSPVGGPYRSPAAREAMWRSAAELETATSGVAYIGRRLAAVAPIGVILVAAAPLFAALALDRSAPMLGYVGALLAVVQLAALVPLARGLFLYAGAPFELAGRRLAIVGLACTGGAIVLFARCLILVDDAAVAGSACAVAGAAFFLAALARSARALGDPSVERAARLALRSHLACAALATAGLALLAPPLPAPAAAMLASSSVLTAFGVAYERLLAGADGTFGGLPRSAAGAG